MDSTPTEVWPPLVDPHRLLKRTELFPPDTAVSAVNAVLFATRRMMKNGAITYLSQLGANDLGGENVKLLTCAVTKIGKKMFMAELRATNDPKYSKKGMV